MAAEDAAVVVTLRANLKDYEAALKSAVRATERAAVASEKTFSNIGKGTTFKAIEGGAQKAGKSLNAMQGDAKNLGFQISDIGTQLASGTSPLLIMAQQGGQVVQSFAGITSASAALKLALSAIVSPIGLITIATTAATLAWSYFFSETDKGSEKAKKALKEHRDLISDVAKAYGDALPALKAFNDYLDSLEKGTKKVDGLKAAIESARDALKKALDTSGTGGIDKVLGIFKSFKNKDMDVSAVIAQWEEFKTKVADGTVTIKEAEAMGVLLNRTLTALPIKVGDSLAVGFMKALAPIQELIQHVQDLNKELKTSTDTVQDMFNKMVPLGSIGAPVVSGAGKFFPSQTEQEIAAGSADIEITRAFLRSKAATQKIADSLENLTDDAVRAFGKLFQNLPESARITSGVRTRAEQEAAYRRYKAGTGGLAARPGHSKHEVGAALDIGAGVDMATLREAVDRNKELETLKGRAYEVDKVHVQLKGTQAKIDEEALDLADKTAEKQAAELITLEKMLETEQQEIALKQKVNEINRDLTLTDDERAVAIAKVTAEAAKEAEVQRLLAQAKEAGLAITPQLIAQYQALAQAKVNAIILDKQIDVAQKNATKATKEQAAAAKQLSQQLASMAQSAISGLVNDLRNGVEAGEAFNNMLNRIIDSLIQMALQQMFNPAGGGGLMSMLFGTAEKGGIVGSSLPKTRRSPLVFAGAPRFAKGGMVGLKAGEVPIIAHRGEMVIPKNMVGRGGGNITNNLGTVNVDMSATGMVSAGTDQARQFGQNVQKLIQLEMVRESRPGGLLRQRGA